MKVIESVTESFSVLKKNQNCVSVYNHDTQPKENKINYFYFSILGSQYINSM
jgi:hypothetical protein